MATEALAGAGLPKYITSNLGSISITCDNSSDRVASAAGSLQLVASMTDNLAGGELGVFIGDNAGSEWVCDVSLGRTINSKDSLNDTTITIPTAKMTPYDGSDAGSFIITLVPRDNGEYKITTCTLTVTY